MVRFVHGRVERVSAPVAGLVDGAAVGGGQQMFIHMGVEDLRAVVLEGQAAFKEDAGEVEEAALEGRDEHGCLVPGSEWFSPSQPHGRQG